MKKKVKKFKERLREFGFQMKKTKIKTKFEKEMALLWNAEPHPYFEDQPN